LKWLSKRAPRWYASEPQFLEIVDEAAAAHLLCPLLYLPGSGFAPSQS
jgi:hypothetical protein